ncbi:MAG: enoyl-CoA hydratase/isomerase family protein [Flavobacteriaceae bacterium]|jgi:enoyl-CoA hydratase/carnithine racemase|nr:enoyl-CoA hydratase/isomerase family protein [Flavobacteriaceae bacterium]
MSLVLSDIQNKVGIITLNAERSLNSLSLPIVESLLALLESWKNNPDVACIFLQGSGEKAFCAGGDIRDMYQAMTAHKSTNEEGIPPKCLDFFIKEYQLDYNIHTYPKPIITWGHGIVMGGGLGLFAGSSHRIVTAQSVLAMPEITIGLYPDVGASYFLNQLPSAFNYYLGLTATRLSAADAIYLKLANYYLDSQAKEEVLAALQQIDWQEDIQKQIDQCLLAFVQPLDLDTSEAKKHLSFIQLFEKVDTIEAFRELLLHYPEKDAWIEAGIAIFSSGSPSAMHGIYRQLKETKGQSLADAFRAELNLSCQCSMHPDFAEGVRALLIDKDRNPNWQPATFEEVTKTWVDSYFVPLWNKEEQPLKHLA